MWFRVCANNWYQSKVRSSGDAFLLLEAYWRCSPAAATREAPGRVSAYGGVRRGGCSAERRGHRAVCRPVHGRQWWRCGNGSCVDHAGLDALSGVCRRKTLFIFLLGSPASVRARASKLKRGLLERAFLGGSNSLCARHYPSALGLLRHLPEADSGASDDGHQFSSSSSSPHRSLFALFRSASVRCRALPALRLAFADVAFAVDISTAEGESILSFAVPAAEAGGIVKNAAGLFLFGVDLSDRNAAIGPGEWRVHWTAVRTPRSGDGAPAAVLMMDANVPAARAAGAISFGSRGEPGVSASLPAPGCGGARLEAEVVVELAGKEKLVEKVRLGVLCQCRYVSADDGLRYLEHFLL